MVDYSKWKDIEISDDEDETHPNIDTPSLFRWRHQARMERMEEAKKEKDDFEKKKTEHEMKIKDLKNKIKDTEKKGENINELQKSLQILELEGSKIKEKESELLKKEKVTPWNVDTISNPGFTKTVINNLPRRNDKDDNLTEEEREERMREFVKLHEKTIKQFGMLRKYEDSKRFLQDNQELVREDTANYLVIWCINLEMESKSELMSHVAHQCICMQYILELSKQLNIDPRACVNSFFSRIQVAEAEYKASFDEELASFKERIKKRAAEKLNDAIKEQEEKDRLERLGPGGLDPIEVYESLPDDLKKCFDTQDIPMLQETISKMPEEEAKYHMKRCVDSGLWVPDGGKKSNNDNDNDNDHNDPTTDEQLQD